MNPIYLDNAATTPLDPRVLDAMMPFFKEQFGNPSAIHAVGRKARAQVEKARRTIAQLMNASTGEIFFTSSATEANNMVMRAAIRDLGVQHIICSSIEHHCVLHSAEEATKEGKIELHVLKVDCLGRADLEHLQEILTKIEGQKSLVSIMHANNEIGTINDLAKISQICEEAGAFLHSDTVQTFAHFPIDVQKLNVHFMVGSAHKFHGPKGIGFLFCSEDVNIKPLIYGGAQERNMRAGTENVAGIVGMARAAELAYDDLEEDKNYISGLRTYMKKELEAAFPGVRFNGDVDGESLYTLLNTSFPAHPKNEMLLMNLDIAGICASGGSACSSGADVGSHVLQCINADVERANVRFSFSKFTTKEELEITVDKLKQILC